MDQECDNQNLRMGIVQETTILGTLNDLYAAYENYIEAKYKINATYELYPEEVVTKWEANDDLPEKIDVLIVSIMMNLAEKRIGDKYKAFSFPMRFNPLLILSKPPRPQISSSMNCFNVDFFTALFLLQCLIMVSSFWTLWQRLHIQNKSSKTNSKSSILLTSLESLWMSFKIFFFEPYIFVPMMLSIRIVTGVWLLAVLILNVNLSSVMSSSFSFVSYKLVDSLKDLRNSKHMFPILMKDGLEERLINLKSEDNDDFRYVRDHVNDDILISLRKALDPDLYIELRENDYLFINYYYLSLMLSFAFDGTNLDNVIYISKPISEDYMVFPYRFNSTRCYKINTIFEQVIIDMSETQWVKPVYFNDLYLMEKLKWRIPASMPDAIQLQDLLSVDLLFCYGIILSVFAIMIEIITWRIKKPKRKLALRRRARKSLLINWN